MAKILVADDEEALRRLLASCLEAEGYELITARNGAEALSLADSQKPDLIILDVVMPLIDGFEVLRLLRKNSVTEDAPVIMLTVKDAEQDIARGWELGVDFYLTKPFELQELLSVIRSLLAREPVPEKNQ
jgi:DNA-binding response OmpR family regulator